MNSGKRNTAVCRKVIEIRNKTSSYHRNDRRNKKEKKQERKRKKVKKLIEKKDRNMYYFPKQITGEVETEWYT